MIFIPRSIESRTKKPLIAKTMAATKERYLIAMRSMDKLFPNPLNIHRLSLLRKTF